MIGYDKYTEVIVPIEAKQVSSYSRTITTNISKVDCFNPENRLSVTVFDAINAEGYALPECIVIPGKKHMENWYINLEPDALVIVNDNSYTNDSIAIQCMLYFAHHSAENDCPNELRFLIVDGHDSHRTEQFLTMVTERDIAVFNLPAYATHFLSPLDVKVFKQCKQIHQKAVDESVRSFEFEYKLSTFLFDLPEIRRQSPTLPTVLSG